MPLPLIAILPALSAGGVLVPHAAGGMIVTTIGATGITGFLMRVGILSSTPVWLAALAGLVMLFGTCGICYFGFWFYKLKQKIKSADNIEEIQFTEKEAWFIEKSIKFLSVTARLFRRMKRRVRKIIGCFSPRKSTADVS